MHQFHSFGYDGPNLTLDILTGSCGDSEGNDNILQSLGFESRVPGNASRFFRTQEEAKQQPTGFLQLAWDPSDPYVRNASFDSALISYDDQYCTTVADLDGQVVIPTSEYFVANVVPHLSENPVIVDIGCGQGEFVDYVRGLGFMAVGYDPVCRAAGVTAGYLRRNFWTEDQPRADLYVMRCVLPHLEHPWDFLDAIARSSPSSFVLVEFQRLEWVITNGVWQQLSHDHVNIFRSQDFKERYDTVAEGTFSSGEWGWVLIKPNSRRSPKTTPPPPRELLSQIEALRSDKALFLSSVEKAGSGVVLVWGAAGKGTIVSHALTQADMQPVAVDADKNRWGLFLEASGTPIISPVQARAECSVGNALVFVANPRHLSEVQRFLPNDARFIRR